MSKIDYVFFLTAYHTGMWFVAKILHHRVGYLFTQYARELNRDLSKIKPFLTIHGHILEEVDLQEIQKIYDLLNKQDKCLMVIPIRDVLASIVSRKRRYPEEPASFIIDEFILIIQVFEKFNPFSFPVDLYTKTKDREGLLTALEGRLGVKIKNVNNVDKKEFAETWPSENKTTDFCLKELGNPRLELKQAYDLKNLDYLKYILSEEWEYLMKKRDILQPFFESLGYKDLLWFKKKTKEK